jgi:hypothetical protein
MDTNVNPSAISAILLLMAAASLFVMLSLNQINYIVQGDLYNYGLQFSYRWAMPYWILSGTVFGLSWTNIALAIIVTLYLYRKSRKQNAPKTVSTQTEKTEATNQLEDGREQRRISEFLEPRKGETSPQEDNVSKEVIGEGIMMVEEKADASAQEQQATPQETVVVEQNTEIPEPPLVVKEGDEEKQSIL